MSIYVQHFYKIYRIGSWFYLLRHFGTDSVSALVQLIRLATAIPVPACHRVRGADLRAILNFTPRCKLCPQG
jgi:hypothetical protein